MGGACTKRTVYTGGERTMENEMLDRQLEESKAREELHFKILCLGAGESGKSTVIKQLTFIHKQQLTAEERVSYVKVLQDNTIQCMTTLIREAEAFGCSFTAEERQSADAVLQFDQRSLMQYELIEDIDRLWQSEAVQTTYARRNEFWHLETTDYYFANAERYVSDGFVPTEEDIVMARKRTTGVVVTELDYGGVHWSCVDVGGQRSERRKWLNCFDNVKAIIYVVNLAGYCKVLFEDKAVNRMHESLNLFEATMSNPLFAHTPVFIFLNKKDLFEQLLRDRNIDCCFPEYGGSNDLHSCIEFISEEYQRRLPPSAPKPTFLLLAARMKKDVQYCFEEVKDILLDLHKKSIGKAKKALERVEKRNKETGGADRADAAEAKAEEAAGGRYKVRGLQGWEATRKPAKLPLRKALPVTSSGGPKEASHSVDASQSSSEPQGGVSVAARRPQVTVEDSRRETEGDSVGLLHSSFPSPVPASSPPSSHLQHEQSVTASTMNIASAAVGPRGHSHSPTMSSMQPPLVTPRADVDTAAAAGAGGRARAFSEEDGRDTERPSRGSEDTKDKFAEEMKEGDDRQPLLHTSSSDASTPSIRQVS